MLLLLNDSRLTSDNDCPSQHYPRRTLCSSSKYRMGLFRAGVPVSVPLSLAVHLTQSTLSFLPRQGLNDEMDRTASGTRSALQRRALCRLFEALHAQQPQVSISLEVTSALSRCPHKKGMVVIGRPARLGGITDLSRPWC